MPFVCAAQLLTELLVCGFGTNELPGAFGKVLPRYINIIITQGDVSRGNSSRAAEVPFTRPENAPRLSGNFPYSSKTGFQE